MSDTPEFWYLDKDGTAVRRYWTPGETTLDLPEDLKMVEVGGLDDLKEVKTDASVLTDDERSHLNL